MQITTLTDLRSENVGLTAIRKQIDTLNKEMSYAKMMEYRLHGNAQDECTDVYFAAHEDDKMLSRLWYGWGKHKNAIGNFGNFLTCAEVRGKGIGGMLLKTWWDDFNSRDDLPLGFFCSAATPELVALYAKFGFRLAIKNTETGALYKPVNDSPEDFEDFCKMYYTPAETLCAKDATVEYRHEIDCLLRFALRAEGVTLGFDGVDSLEAVLMGLTTVKAKILFTEENKVAGWAVSDGDKWQIQSYPIYKNSTVIW